MLRVLHRDQIEMQIDNEVFMRYDSSVLGNLYAPVKTYFRRKYGAKISMAVAPLHVGSDRRIDFIYHETPSSYDIRPLLQTFNRFVQYYAKVEGKFSDSKAYVREMAPLMPIFEDPERFRPLAEMLF